MKLLINVFTIFLILVSCSSSKKMTGGTYGSPNIKQELIDDKTFKVNLFTLDSTYGYKESNPIMVGGGLSGPKNERRFLNALQGANGEAIEYERLGSCCPFETNNGAFKMKNGFAMGMLDRYLIKFKGTDKSISLFINMYDSDTLKVPVGFQIKQ